MIWWILAALITIGSAFYLILFSRGESRFPKGLITGYAMLVVFFIFTGLMASQSTDSGFFMFVITIYIILPCMLLGSIIAFVYLEGWGKLHVIFTGIISPLLIVAALILGSEYAPKPLSLEDKYIPLAEEVLKTFQDSMNTSNLQAYDFNRCNKSLQEKLSEHDGTYQLEFLGADNNGGATGSIVAEVEVKFPDGARFKLHFYAGAWEYCTDLNDTQ